ncbi:alpha/beta fold hydrolase [Micromonospora sp. WMMA1976]|uniref:thioesterase domain-containing protein n=1 Tax=Micromonospora sp. WMMA1976 TaxID=3014995 RepID=UPI00248B46E8|nr:alpha/beta fold hydrolase [Micromonospora sp. WMMA1976]WBC01105.1 thioesterase domain-containing protein [Micromonospora sp. WMMA1976]
MFADGGVTCPVAALSSPGWQGAPPAPWSLDLIASRYVDEIRRRQPVGPYLVCGCCTGGILAYEIACRLAALGEDIAGLVLIDPDLELDEQRWPTPDSLLATRLDWLRSNSRPGLAKELVTDMSISDAARLAAEYPGDVEGEERKELAALFNTILVNVDMCRNYQPPREAPALPTRLILAGDKDEHDVPLGRYEVGSLWQFLSSTDLLIDVVEATHDDVMSAPRLHDILNEVAPTPTDAPQSY